MRSFIHKLYNEEIRDAFQTDFRIERIEKINQGDESFTYRAVRDSEKVILKIVHSSHRKKNHIIGEIDWVKFLLGKKVSVSMALKSKNGTYVESEKTDDDSCFYATLWKEARGHTIDNEPWDDLLIQNWGKLIGKMHTVTQKYKPNEKYKRPQWNEMFSMQELARDLKDHKDVFKKQVELNSYLEGLPKPSNAYDLIHADIESENLFLNDDKLTLIDFDDCQYNWFVFDIAVILRASTWQMPNRSEYKDSMKWFIQNFMKGYLSACKIDARWLREISIMLRVIELRSYIHALTKMDRSKFSDAEKAWFTKARMLIIKGEPIVDISKYL